MTPVRAACPAVGAFGSSPVRFLQERPVFTRRLHVDYGRICHQACPA